MHEPPLALHPRYELLEPVGQGSQAVVWRARDLDAGVEVALKAPAATDAEESEEFVREAETLSRLRHPSIVGLRDVGRFRGQPYFTMDLLDGVSLETRVRARAATREETCALLEIAVDILHALAHVHEAGLAHGDLKPSNVRLLETEEGPSVKILDFGFARDQRVNGGARADVTGTLLYMAPECLRGQRAEPASDLYSLGALLYHCLTGRPPFESLGASLKRDPPPPPLVDLCSECPRAVSDQIHELLSEDRESRGESAGKLATAFTELLSSTGLLVSRRPDALTVRIRQPRFIGRGAELATLRESLSRVCAQRREGVLVRITGEKGVGKTWLVRESEFRVHVSRQQDARLVSGSFAGISRRFRGMSAVFHTLLADLSTTPEETVELLGGGAADFLRAWNIDSRVFESGDFESCGHDASSPRADAWSEPPDRERVLATSLRLLRDSARRSPLVVILEDLEAASELETDLVGWILRSLDELPILLVVTYATGALRDANPTAADLMADLVGRRHPPPMELGSFADDELRQFAEASLEPRRPLCEGLLEELLSRAGAQPRAIQQTLRAWVERDQILVREGAYDFVLQQSDASVDGLDHAALGALTELEHRVLVAVSIEADRAEGATLLRLIDLLDDTEKEKIRAAARRLVRLGWLLADNEGYTIAATQQGSPAFTERSLPEILETDAARALRVRAANRILREHAFPSDEHQQRAASLLSRGGETTRAAELFLAAARSFSRSYSNSRARRCFQAALELTDDSAARSAASHELGVLEVRVGNYEEALECFTESLRSLDAAAADGSGAADLAARGRRLLLRDRIGRVRHRQGRLEDARASFEECLREAEDIDDSDLIARSEYRLGSVGFDEGDLSEARRRFDRSLELYGNEVDSKTLVPIHLGLGLIHKREGRAADAIESFESALRAANDSGQLVDAARIEGNLGNLYRARGETDRAVECLESSTRIRNLVGDRQGLAICLNNMSRIHVHRGEYAIARDATARALESFRAIGDTKGVLITLCNLGETLVALSDVLSARQVLEENLALAKQHNAVRLRENILCVLSKVDLLEGKLDRAETTARRALKDTSFERPRALRAQALSTLAEILLEAGRTEEANDSLREAWELIAEDPAYEKGAELLSIRVRLLREREGPAEALALLEDYAIGGAAVPERYGEARLDEELGIVYRELGPDWADRTEKHLDRAAGAFEKMGCRVDAARVLGEFAVYWQLVGEEEIAEECIADGESLLEGDGLAYQQEKFRKKLEEGAP